MRSDVMLSFQEERSALKDILRSVPAHVMNLIVKAGLKHVEVSLNNIRESVKHLKSSQVFGYLHVGRAKCVSLSKPSNNFVEVHPVVSQQHQIVADEASGECGLGILRQANKTMRVKRSVESLPFL
ncbi:hypothetical protein IFM89_026823 [Coptis chinensis]|uniref:Uncharacterized protein n=1 Tax=Coptis chinensis TaxID=261450 RepID=A0A835H966_9MAGN|nr:hypothetical protein IFM89_026823 [Coptis chinensis]